jgi:beta-lactamase class A
VTPTQSTSLAAYVDALPSSGSFSIWFGPGTGDPYLTHRADEPHYAASTMKLALVMAVYREAAAGALDLDVPVRVHNSFASRHDGSVFSIDPEEDSDPEPWRHLGEDVALRWLCYRAIVRSSNLATNLVLDAVGTTAVAAVLDRVGARDSTVTRGIADLARTLQALWSETLLSPDDSREVLAVLAAQQINDAIPARLPSGSVVAHKSGWIEGISHDAGIVHPAVGDGGEPFVFVMCTTSDLDEQTGLDLIAGAAAAAYTDRRV